MDRRNRQPRGRRQQPPAQAPVRKRRISRAEREARRQRLLYLGVGLAGAAIVLVLAVGAINEYFVKPRQVLATVDGVNIRRRDYWKFRANELVNQVSAYQNAAQQFGGDQAQQYIAFAQQAQAELEEVWGTTAVDDATLERMIEDQVYLQYADDLGVTITDQDVDTWILTQFDPENAPLVTATPSPTLIPTRAAWATETAVAQATQDAASQATATADAAALATAEAAASPGADALASPQATPVASPEGMPTAAGAAPTNAAPDPTLLLLAPPAIEASPAASPEGSPAASPIAEGSPAASPTPAATPNPTEALSTAEVGYEQFQDAVFDVLHMSEADYRRLIARPAVTRERVEAVLHAGVGQTAEQVHAAHILVDTRDLAQSIRDQLNQPGVSFEDLARQSSTDTGTAPNGGDLGWFTRNMMVDQFAEVAFSLPPGQISDPFETEFGWHVVTVYEHAADRPMTDEQIQAEQQAVVDEWIQARLAEAEIDSDIEPTPTPAPGSQEFVPPPDAPPTPTAVASPVGSPEAVDGTPEPGATPIASPVVASPAA